MAISITPEMRTLINTLPTDLKTSGTSVNIQQMVENALSRDSKIDRDEEFEEAINACDSVKDEDTIYKIYLRTFSTWDKFKKAETPLVKVYEQLGLSEMDNPFSIFLVKYFKVTDGVPGVGDLTIENITMLFNLLAEGVLEDIDIRGENVEGKDGICYNPYIYKLNKSDGEFMITSYMWLSEETNIDRMNLPAIGADVSLPANIRSAGSIVDADKDVAHVRPIIIYKDPTKSGQSAINEKKYVEKALRDASSKIGMARETSDTKVKRILRDIVSLTDEEKETLINALTDEEES